MAVNGNENKRSEKAPLQKKSKQGLRVNYLIIFLSGLFILFAGILVFLLIVKNVYGNYDLKQILPTKENINKIGQVQKFALLYSKYTENRFEPGNTWVQDNLSTWEAYLGIIKYQYDIISDFDIETGKLKNYKFLILPGSQSLSDIQIVEIKKFLERGGSIFATGGTASYSDEGKWRGWDFFTEVFGLKFNREMKPDELYRVHTLRGNLPLTANIPTGYALQIASWDRPIYAEVLEPRTTQVSFWYDYRKEAGLVREEIQKSAGIAYGSYGEGRFVWFGFELNSVIGKQTDYIFFERLFRNSVNWLTYSPTSFVKDWPAPYEAAALLVPVITENAANVNNLIPLLNKYKTRTTFFYNADDLNKYRGILSRLSNGSDLGTVSDIGFLETAQDTSNKLFDKESQNFILRSIKDSTLKYTGTEVKSFMPTHGFYDENTFQALSKNDYLCLVTDSLTDRSVPKTEIRNNRVVMVITKTARDDIEIINNYGLTNDFFQLYTYEEDVDRLLFEGGLYVLKLHTDLQLRPEYVNVIDDLLKYIKEKKMWITSISELYEWWKRKGGIEIRYDTRSSRRITVEVSNPRETEMLDFVVQVNLNKRVKNIVISADIINTKIPKYEFDSRNNYLYLFFDRLKSGESNLYLIDFENVQS